MYRLLNKKPLILFYAENKIYFQKLLIYEVFFFFFKQINENNLYMYITKYI